MKINAISMTHYFVQNKKYINTWGINSALHQRYSCHGNKWTLLRRPLEPDIKQRQVKKLEHSRNLSTDE